MERLQKVMARCGVASRRSSEELILKGHVKVNGKVVSDVGVKVDEYKDLIEVKGKAIDFQNLRTFVFFKPLMVITSMSDPRGRKTVADYLDKIEERVYPVGRLDYSTEGLLILTNDGDLSLKLSHPRHGVEKQYIAVVKGNVDDALVDKLSNGVMLEEGMTSPCKVKVLEKNSSKTKLQITLKEGKNRQIRRMCNYIGHPVEYLIRTKIAFLGLVGLKRGKYRELNGIELLRLKNMLK